MTPQQFKEMIESCVKQAKEKGLSDEAVLIELLEQVKFMLVQQTLKLAAAR